MRLLLDQGLPRSTVLYLQNYGIEAVHVGDRGLATASDSEVLNIGQQEGMVVVTLDADFHTLLALCGLARPSVVRVRIEGLRPFICPQRALLRFRKPSVSRSFSQLPPGATLARCFS